MTYVLLCVGFVAVALLVAAAAWRRAPRGHAAALAVSAAVLVVLTAVFDNVMIATGLFGYADAHISGARVGLAPVEDFAYPIAGVLLLPAVWNLLGGRRPPTTAGGASVRPAEEGAAPAGRIADGRRDGDRND